MLSEKMLKALTYQLNREIYSGYFYLGMAGYAAKEGYKGFTNWFKKQWQEELEHADRLFDYIDSRGDRVMMGAIEAPPQEFSSVVELFEKTLEHEKKVSGLINELVELAKQENDKETEDYLQWFVKEQIEEEATPTNILKKIDANGKEQEGLLKTDALLASRK